MKKGLDFEMWQGSDIQHPHFQKEGHDVMILKDAGKKIQEDPKKIQRIKNQDQDQEKSRKIQKRSKKIEKRSRNDPERSGEDPCLRSTKIQEILN